MVMMTDTEHQELPSSGNFEWDIDLWGDGTLLLGVPNYFIAFDAHGFEKIYNSDGVLEVNLRDLLEDYLKSGGCGPDGRDNNQKIMIDTLREYADKLELYCKTPEHIEWVKQLDS